jgi:hypothetical protein
MKRFRLKYKNILAALLLMLGLLGNVGTCWGQRDEWNVGKNQFRDPFAHSPAFGDERSGSLRGGITPDPPGNGPAQGEETPLGDAVPFLVYLTLTYGLFLLKNKNRHRLFRETMNTDGEKEEKE